MLSIWERNAFIQYDHIILGSGIVGLSTAYYLNQRFPNQRILILERGLLPSGASTKNAGFACMGSLSELLDDKNRNSVDEICELFALRRNGLHRLQSILGPAAMGYQAVGSYELINKANLPILDQINFWNKQLRAITGTEVFKNASHRISEFGFKQVDALIENCCEGSIDTGRMMQHFIQLLGQQGVEFKTGCEVLGLEEASHQVAVCCRNPLPGVDLHLYASHVYICTNAFAASWLEDEIIQPGRGQVLITHPIPQLKWKGIFHLDKGYYYFREYQGRILLGGGRNKDLLTETTTELALNEMLQEGLEHLLQTCILPGIPYSVDMRWSGIMAFGPDKRPIVKSISPRIHAGVRMGGMGVAIGSEIGFQLSQCSQ